MGVTENEYELLQRRIQAKRVAYRVVAEIITYGLGKPLDGTIDEAITDDLLIPASGRQDFEDDVISAVYSIRDEMIARANRRTGD